MKIFIICQCLEYFCLENLYFEAFINCYHDYNIALLFIPHFVEIEILLFINYLMPQSCKVI